MKLIKTPFSYSRQNLLSTKSNDGMQNTLERSNNSSERPQPYYYLPPNMGAKQNTIPHDSTNSSEDTTPRQRLSFKTAISRTNAATSVPPDVLNVNQVPKANDDLPDFSLHTLTSNDGDSNLASNFQHPFLNIQSFGNANSSNYNISDEYAYKESVLENGRNRNEWQDEALNEHSAK